MYKAQIGLIIAAALVLSFIAGWSLYPLLQGETSTPETTQTAGEDVVIVTIDNGNGDFEELPPVPYAPGDSVLSVLQVLEEVDLVTLSLTDLDPTVAAVDVALSQLAESPTEPGWHFWINDTYATMPPEAYRVEPGDHIHLVFTPASEEE